MTIHDFSEALQEQGSKIHDAFAGLQQPGTQEELGPDGPGGGLDGWTQWY